MLCQDSECSGWAPQASRKGRSSTGIQVPRSSSVTLLLPSAQVLGKTSDLLRVQTVFLLMLLCMIIRIIIVKKTGL